MYICRLLYNRLSKMCCLLSKSPFVTNWSCQKIAYSPRSYGSTGKNTNSNKRSIMFNFKDGMTLEDLKDYTVLMPIMIVMNSSQLALDVLIASKKMKRIGQLTDFAIMPVYGPSPFTHCPEDKAAAAELYAVPEEKLLVIQFRSALVFKYIGPFLKKMAQSFKQAQIQRVIVLSNPIGFQLEDDYCYSASESFKKTHSKELSSMNWKENDISGVINDKLIFKALGPESVPAMILYHNLSLPVDDIDEKYAVKLLNDLIVNFLKIGDNLKPCIPTYWKDLLDNETAELMY